MENDPSGSRQAMGIPDAADVPGVPDGEMERFGDALVSLPVEESQQRLQPAPLIRGPVQDSPNEKIPWQGEMSELRQLCLVDNVTAAYPSIVEVRLQPARPSLGWPLPIERGR